MTRYARAFQWVLVGGWLLMTIPPGNPKAPVVQWTQEGAYDSASDCQRQLFGIQEASKKGYAEASAQGKDQALKQLDLWLNARCVPAEHVYPPAKP